MLSFLYTPTPSSIHDYWEIIAWTRWTFVGKAMSLLFNMLSRLVITFLPRSKCLLISRLQSLAVNRGSQDLLHGFILEPRMADRIQGNTWLTRAPFFTRCTTHEQPNKIHNARHGEVLWDCIYFPCGHPCLFVICLGALKLCCLGYFIDMIGGWGLVMKFQFFNQVVGSSGHQPWSSKSYLMSINSDVVERGLLGITKYSPLTPSFGKLQGF